MLSVRWVTVVGGMCYSIYLLHLFVIQGLGQLTREWTLGAPYYWVFLAQQVVLVGSVVMAISVAYFVVVERPCMDPRWPEKLRAALAERMSPVRRVPVAD
jgi:peptidoglycan/LPS O-acetylase OafA/YrhL